MAGGALMALGGIALGVFMFLNWYEVAGAFGPEKVNAWDALRRADVVIFVLAVIGFAVGAATMLRRPGAAPSQLRPLGLVGAAAGALAALIIVIRMVSPPGDAEVAFGVVLGLIAAAVIALGGVIAALAAPR